jgi:hypothetical protein
MTSRGYRRPYRPLVVRLGNGLAAAVGASASLDPAALVAAARRLEGLHDLGDPDPTEPLAVLCAALDREARLTPMGRFIQRQRIVGALRARLRVRALEAAGATAPIEPPIVIAALQRTGTTLLHRLLASDPDLRALRSWEALNPAPFDPPEFRGEDSRKRVARRAEEAVKWLAPDFFAVHPIDALAPEEDVLLLDQALIPTVPEATLHVPTYAAWVEAVDPTPAYAYLRTCLEVLTRQQGPATWVLKTPHHLEWLDVLLATFPGARIVWTHRDPKQTLASFCSMVAHAQGLSSDHVDPEAIGVHWLRKTARMVDRALATRDRVGEDVFVDVAYADLVSDPLAAVRRLYERLGRALPSTRHLEAAIATERAGRHGHHAYALDDFGLSPAAVDEAFAAYRRRFPPSP